MCHLVYKKGEKERRIIFKSKNVGWIRGERGGLREGFVLLFPIKRC